MILGFCVSGSTACAAVHAFWRCRFESHALEANFFRSISESDKNCMNFKVLIHAPITGGSTKTYRIVIAYPEKEIYSTYIASIQVYFA